MYNVSFHCLNHMHVLYIILFDSLISWSPRFLHRMYVGFFITICLMLRCIYDTCTW